MTVLSPLLDRLRTEPALAALDRRGRDARVSVPTPARAVVLAALARKASAPLVVVVDRSTEAEVVAADIDAFLGDGAAAVFPAWETLPYEHLSPTSETMGRRLELLYRLGGRGGEAPLVTVVAVRALLQRLAPSTLGCSPLLLRTGAVVDLEDVARWLAGSGYERVYQVESRGEFAVRGGILDVFPPTLDTPVRMELWGDEVDHLRPFSLADQRSLDEKLDEACVFPVREFIPTEAERRRASILVATEPWNREVWDRLADGHLFAGMESWLPWVAADEGAVTLVDVLPADTRLVIADPKACLDRARELRREEEEIAAALATTWGEEDADRERPRLFVDPDSVLAADGRDVAFVLPAPENPDTPAVDARGWGETARAPVQIRHLLAEGCSVIVTAEGAGSAERLRRIFLDEGLELPLVEGPPRRGGAIVVAHLVRGFVLAGARLAVLTEADLRGRHRPAARRRGPARRRTDVSSFYADLEPGDFVVHYHHGVGRYAGLVTREIGGQEREYLLLDYAANDKLYIPTDQFDAVKRYTGGESPRLHRLGGADWQRTRARVRAEVAEIAEGLVSLYRIRLTAPGHAFAPDTPWQRELEEAFPYVETPDQMKAIDDVKEDMQTPVPMDRLVCGDVGYGKTEIAVRAAFKAVQGDAQVGVLVPTTLLAQQHFQTFSERFAPYPVRVEMLSRFLTAKESKAVVEGIGDGSVDVVIGTHRLLSADVKWKNLGLIVVDEEQRFGVQHKEAIKQLKASVDCVTLTATPIPRTLEMSLAGIRDMTTVNTPPEDRQPVLTFVGAYDSGTVAAAIRREMLREGRVFYVHNRVRSIDRVTKELADLVPDARIGVAHGQMDEASLERVMVSFWQGEYDVLVCTTIVESGLDIPNANTLIVERSDLLGLAQLYQLRGRVGRAGERAYAYFFYPPDREMTQEAYERLKTIGEHTQLGSGFAIAMRDLEIRGAGNLLGEAQSGHIAAVGFDLYCQLVAEAVGEMTGAPVPDVSEVRVDLPLDAHLPSAYIEKEDLRLAAYRRLAEVRSAAEVDDVASEWEDRYGPLPDAAVTLLDAARLRSRARELGVGELAVVRGQAKVSPVKLSVSRQVRLERLHPKAKYKEDLGELVVPVPPQKEKLLPFLTTLLDDVVAR